MAPSAISSLCAYTAVKPAPNDWATFRITCCPLAREKSPVCDATTFIPGCLAISSRNPCARSRATDEPGVPVSSTTVARPFVVFASQSAARRPWSTKLEPRKVT
jgi:hypothetical protein